MATSVEKKMIGWISRAAGGDDVLDRLVLRHVQAEGKHGAEVATIKLLEVGRDKEAIASRQTPEALATRVLETAEQDASALGGVQRYMLQAYMLAEERPRSRFTFRASGPNDDEEDQDAEGQEALSEPPNMRGLTSQLMRHTEALMRQSTMATMHQMEMQARIIAKQEDTISSLVEEKLSTIEAIEELRSRKHERDLSEKRETAALDDKRQIFDAVKMLLPVAVNRLAGGKVLPEHKSATEMAFEAFLDSLTSDQLQQIMSSLTPAQQAAVATILQSRMAEQEASNKQQ